MANNYIIIDEFSNSPLSKMGVEEVDKLKNMENDLKEGWSISFNEECGYGKPYFQTKKEALDNAKDLLFKEEDERYDLFNLDDSDKLTLEQDGFIEKDVYVGYITLLTPEKLSEYIGFGDWSMLQEIEESLAEGSVTYEEELLPEHDDYSDINLIIAKALFEKFPELKEHTYLDLDRDDGKYEYSIQITQEDINKYKEQYE